jgi:ferredoxin
MVEISVMGKKYKVPEGLTILQALWFIGYKTIRGVGCLGGFCGACATVFRIEEEDWRLHVGLACQTQVREGMHLAQIPFFPVKSMLYDFNKIKDINDILLEIYPDTQKCISCGTCNKVCPQNLNVMGYIIKANAGEFDKVVDWSFDCINCGICAMKCPADIAPNLIAKFVRRKFVKLTLKRSELLAKRIKEIKEGKFDNEWRKIAQKY